MLYGFIYITTNMANGKKYLGQKKFDSHWKSYIGSGKALKKAVEKYGKENFSRNIVTVCNSPEELNKAERELSVFLNVVNSPDWYNEVYGGGAICGFHFSEASKRKNSLSHVGKRHTEEAKRKMSEIQKVRMSNPNNQPSRGKTASAETRKRMSEARKGIFAGANSSTAIGVVVTKANGTIQAFGSIKEAERETGIDRCTIVYHLKNRRPLKNGDIWRYAKGG